MNKEFEAIKQLDQKKIIIAEIRGEECEKIAKQLSEVKATYIRKGW